jgi:PAS domain S-box-containing protein
MTSDLLATISLDGRFTLLNPAWEQVLGWTIEELKAHPMQELVHPDDVEQTLALMLARATTDPAQFENFTNRYRHRTARGAGCCGARAATARPGTRPPRT